MTYKFALTSTGPLSGKTTLAKHLEQEHGFIHASHSLTLVQSFVDNWNNPLPYAEQITVEQVNADKEQWRPLLQQYGYDAGFNDPGRMVYWVKQTLKGSEGRNVVFEAVRGETQSQVLRDTGFMLVQLKITEEEREYRAIQLGKDYEQIRASMEAHPELEMGIAKPNLTINAELPLDVQARILWVSWDLFEGEKRARERGELRIFGSYYQPKG